MRRILSAIVTVLGLVAIALAVCSATIWRPSSTVEASLAQSPTQPYVVTEPGVLGAIGSDVTVTATAEGGQEVRVIVARATDVQAWLDTDPYVSVTGLSADASTLEATEVTEKCEADAGSDASGRPTQGEGGCTPREASGVNPADSDLWITEHTGSGSVTFEQSAADAQVVVMAVTDGTASAPSLSLSWPRTVETPWYFYAGLVLGGLLVLVGVFLFLIDIQMRHAEAQRRTRAAERAARVARADGVATASIPQLDDPNRQLTRRELRDKERAEKMGEEWIDPRTGRVHRDGVEAPDVPTAPAGLPDQGAQGAPWQPATSQGGTAGDSGAARGAAILPGLDQATTQAHRATRDLGDQPAFSVSTSGMDASTAEVPAYQDGLPGHPPAGGGDGWGHSGPAAPWPGADQGAGVQAAGAQGAGGQGTGVPPTFEADPGATQAFTAANGPQGWAAAAWQQEGAQARPQQAPASWGQDLGHGGPVEAESAAPAGPAAVEAPFSGSDHATPARPGPAMPEQPAAPVYPEAPVTPSVPAMPGTTQDAWAGPGGQAGPDWPAAPSQQEAVPSVQTAQAPRTPAAPLGAAEAGSQVEDYRVSEEEIRAANAVPLSPTDNPTHEERP